MNNEQTHLGGCMLTVFAISFVLAVVVGIWVLKSHMEARSFNAVTGKSVTTWEAMWIELRVQEGGKEEVKK